MRRLHIPQDEHGFWVLAIEHVNGELGLLAHQFTRPEHLIQDATELIFGCVEGSARYPGAQIIIDAPRGQVSEDPETWPINYDKPSPRKALV